MTPTKTEADYAALVSALTALSQQWRKEADRAKLLQGLKCADDLDAVLASAG